MTSRHPLTRRFGAPLLALLLLGQLAGFSHLVAERHHVCAEHGEAVEGPVLEGHDRPSSAAAIAMPGEPGEQGHHHCTHCGASRTAPETRADTGTRISTEAPRRDPPRVAAIPPAPNVPVYRVAPKNSPPERA